MYSRIAKTNQRKVRNITISVLGTILSLAVAIIIVSQLTHSFTTRAEAEVVKSTSTSKQSSSTDQKVTSPSSTDASTSSSSVTEETNTSTEEIQEIPETEVAYSEAEAVATTDNNAANVQTNYSQDYTVNNMVEPTSNGNTAGATGTDAASQMAAATGVSQSTWEAIIARESNGDPTATNSSGASGLFQTMPGWGSTATVQDQINAAINAYNTQGLSAWGY